jgi:hypothetical protein
MGGHGFSSFARIGQLKSESESEPTYEGENHVLKQQAAKFVLGAWGKLQRGGEEGKRTQSPLGSIDFLQDACGKYRY